MTIEMPTYRRSWVNAVIDWVERLPGPAWVAYLAALVAATLFVAAQDWISGVPTGQILPDRVVWAAAFVGSIWLIHHLDRVARSALKEFGSLLESTPEVRARLEFEMTVIPRMPALVILVLTAFRTAEGFAFQPGTEGLAGMSPLALAMRFPFETVLTALVLTLLYHTARQLRLVGRLHAEAPRINLFRPAPLYAFSRLTSQTAIGLVPLLVPFGSGLTAATTALDYAVLLGLCGLILGTAMLAFFLPLIGMHRRMAAEKRRLLDEVGQRVEVLVGELHRSVDRGDLSSADGQNKQLGSLIAERDLVGRLSTWPWQAGTAGAVVSAIGLPIVLWVLTRVMGRLI